MADRKKWKDIVRQAKAHSGLYCQWKKKNITDVMTTEKKAVVCRSLVNTVVVENISVVQ